jgi:hypothetical protein
MVREYLTFEPKFRAKGEKNGTKNEKEAGR